ncbi:MAG: M28 family peptidase [Asgard group archaeon]|nr:M28 family peptidase [Asgard group archaeon]
MDVERLYKHILRLEGVRHPVKTPKKFNEDADYIKSEFKKYGLQTSEQKFHLEYSDFKFRNIEGTIGSIDKPTILITSHYDTMGVTPGADDNGSGIAVMLETARIIAENNSNYNIQFVCFTLEECNPIVIELAKEKAKALGLMDHKDRYLNYHVQKIMKKVEESCIEYLKRGLSVSKTIEKVYSQIENDLTDEENEYIEFIFSFAIGKTVDSIIGTLGNVGSTKWVEKAVQDKRKIVGVLNLDSVGYISNKPHSQEMNRVYSLIFPSYKMKFIRKIGDFIVIVGDRKSKLLAKTFYKQCRRKEINLPSICYRVPFNYNQIIKWYRDLVRSDHAPFWRVGIPALMLTDTCDMRNPFYHRRADTIDKLDFDFMKKVCQATIGTTIKLSE